MTILPGYELAETLCPPCLMAAVPVARCFKARCAAAWAKDGKERRQRETVEKANETNATRIKKGSMLQTVSPRARARGGREGAPA
jgi:hypothetical protein